MSTQIRKSDLGDTHTSFKDALKPKFGSLSARKPIHHAGKIDMAINTQNSFFDTYQKMQSIQGIKKAKKASPISHMIKEESIKYPDITYDKKQAMKPF